MQDGEAVGELEDAFRTQGHAGRGSGRLGRVPPWLDDLVQTDCQQLGDGSDLVDQVKTEDDVCEESRAPSQSSEVTTCSTANTAQSVGHQGAQPVA